MLFVPVEVVTTDDVAKAFLDIDVCIMVGAMPRREGMERKDLLKANAKIFETQGKALDQYAKKTVKVGHAGVVVVFVCVYCIQHGTGPCRGKSRQH